MEEGGDNLEEEEVGAGSRMGMEARKAEGETPGQAMEMFRMEGTTLGSQHIKDRHLCAKHLLISPGAMVMNLITREAMDQEV